MKNYSIFNMKHDIKNIFYINLTYVKKKQKKNKNKQEKNGKLSINVGSNIKLTKIGRNIIVHAINTNNKLFLNCELIFRKKKVFSDISQILDNEYRISSYIFSKQIFINFFVDIVKIKCNWIDASRDDFVDLVAFA